MSPTLHASEREKPPTLYGYVHTSPGAQVTLTIHVARNTIVTRDHRLVRRGAAGPRGRFYFRVHFHFRVSEPMATTIIIVARDPLTGERSRTLLPLTLFPAHD